MEGLKISKILNNDTMVGSSHNDIAICYSDLLNSEKALKNYKKALKLSHLLSPYANLCRNDL